MKDCSTFVAFFALVSKNGIPRESANSCEARNSEQWAHTPTHSSPAFLVHLPNFPDPHPNPVWLVPKHLAGHLWHTNTCVPSCFPTLNSTAFMAQPSTEPSPPVSVPTYLCCCIVYYFLCGQITFVPHQQLVDVFTGIAVYLLQPLFYIIERLLGDKRAVSKAPHREAIWALFSSNWKQCKATYVSVCSTTTGDRTPMLLHSSTAPLPIPSG